jgi:hypothetical protein
MKYPPIQDDRVLIDVRQIMVEIDTVTTESSQDQTDQWEENGKYQFRNQAPTITLHK